MLAVSYNRLEEGLVANCALVLIFEILVQYLLWSDLLLFYNWTLSKERLLFWIHMFGRIWTIFAICKWVKFLYSQSVLQLDRFSYELHLQRFLYILLRCLLDCLSKWIALFTFVLKLIIDFNPLLSFLDNILLAYFILISWLYPKVLLKEVEHLKPNLILHPVFVSCAPISIHLCIL